MAGDETIGGFGDAGEKRGMSIPIEEELFARVVCQGAESGFGAAIDRAVDFDEVDGGCELLAQFGKADGHCGVLEGEIVNTIVSDALPAPDP